MDVGEVTARNGALVIRLGSLIEYLRRPGKRRHDGTPSRLKAQEEFSRALSLIVGLDELLDNEIGKIRALTRVDRVAILVSTARQDAFTVGAGRGYAEADLADVVFHDGAHLTKWLYTNETYLVPSQNPEVTAYLRSEEREMLARLDVEAVLPLLASNRLVGMIFLSGWNGGGLDTLPTLWALVPQMALALENAVLYEHQRLRMRRLYRAERLATTGQLAAGAAHEIRNPLTSIRSTIQYLQRAVKDDAELSEMVGDLLGETDRINAIVEGMLSFARRTEPRFEQLDLREVIAQTVRLVDPTARKAGVEVETQAPDRTCALRGDPDQLKQMLLNVMMNGVQAMPSGGQLRVRLDRSPNDAFGWRVQIEDTGQGISGDDQEKAFDPFYTTKSDGTGLGLSISHSIVQEHGGEMEIESAEGNGTRVEIRL